MAGLAWKCYCLNPCHFYFLRKKTQTRAAGERFAIHVVEAQLKGLGSHEVGVVIDCLQRVIVFIIQIYKDTATLKNICNQDCPYWDPLVVVVKNISRTLVQCATTAPPIKRSGKNKKKKK